MANSEEFLRGYQEAERQFLADAIMFVSPFEPETDEDLGFQEAVYDFTQK